MGTRGPTAAVGPGQIGRTATYPERGGGRRDCVCVCVCTIVGSNSGKARPPGPWTRGCAGVPAAVEVWLGGWEPGPASDGGGQSVHQPIRPSNRGALCPMAGSSAGRRGESVQSRRHLMLARGKNMTGTMGSMGSMAQTGAGPADEMAVGVRRQEGLGSVAASHARRGQAGIPRTRLAEGGGGLTSLAQAGAANTATGSMGQQGAAWGRMGCAPCSSERAHAQPGKASPISQAGLATRSRGCGMQLVGSGTCILISGPAAPATVWGARRGGCIVRSRGRMDGRAGWLAGWLAGDGGPRRGYGMAAATAAATTQVACAQRACRRAAQRRTAQAAGEVQHRRSTGPAMCSVQQQQRQQRQHRGGTGMLWDAQRCTGVRWCGGGLRCAGRRETARDGLGQA